MKTKLATSITWVRTKLVTSEIARLILAALVAFIVGALVF